jgi:hypothetical protein
VVGEVAAERARDRRARAVERCDDAGLRRGEPAPLREVDREERHDEAARAIHQHAAPQHPEGARQAAHHGERARAGFGGHVHAGLEDSGGKNGLRPNCGPEPRDFRCRWRWVAPHGGPRRYVPRSPTRTPPPPNDDSYCPMDHLLRRASTITEGPNPPDPGDRPWPSEPRAWIPRGRTSAVKPGEADVSTGKARAPP